MRVAVDASRLTQWIGLENPPTGPVPDGEGGYIDTPQPLVPPHDWAAVEPALSTSDELPIANTVQGSLTHRVLLRYRPDVTLQTQITFQDLAGKTRRLFVRAVQNPLQQSEALQLWCEEKI